MELRALEFLDRRILAALRFVDVLGRRVEGPVAVHAPAGVRHFRKPGGGIVITEAPGLDAHSAAFAAPPAAPAPGSVAVALDLVPAARGLAPRRAVVGLPRDPDPGAAETVLRAVDIPLLPSVLAEPVGVAAALHVTLRRSTDGFLVEGALVRLRRGGQPDALAVTNASGEARLIVPDVPLARPGPNATVLGHVEGALAAIVPAAARFHDPADAAGLAAARRAEAERTTGLADPDALAGGTAGPDEAVAVAAAETRTATIDWTPT